MNIQTSTNTMNIQTRTNTMNIQTRTNTMNIQTRVYVVSNMWYILLGRYLLPVCSSCWWRCGHSS